MTRAVYIILVHVALMDNLLHGSMQPTCTTPMLHHSFTEVVNRDDMLNQALLPRLEDRLTVAKVGLTRPGSPRGLSTHDGQADVSFKRLAGCLLSRHTKIKRNLAWCSQPTLVYRNWQASVALYNRHP
jgi:hypothetical protein